jgi:hypothetical protein
LKHHNPTLPDPPSLRVEFDAGYMLLAQRIVGHGQGGGEGSPDGAAAGGPPLTALGRSLAAIRDPDELSKKWVSGPGVGMEEGVSWAGEEVKGSPAGVLLCLNHSQPLNAKLSAMPTPASHRTTR